MEDKKEDLLFICYDDKKLSFKLSYSELEMETKTFYDIREDIQNLE